MRTEIKAEHTHGPWTVVHKTNNHGAMASLGTEIRAGDTSLADLRWNGHNEVHGEANAQLMAAAPEMLEALELASTVLFLLSDEVATLGHHAPNVAAKVKAAIKKARGE